jgi:hypothetical protein
MIERKQTCKKDKIASRKKQNKKKKKHSFGSEKKRITRIQDSIPKNKEKTFRKYFPFNDETILNLKNCL